VYAEAQPDPGSASRQSPEYAHYRLNECRRCDSLYANPLPAREAPRRAYVELGFDGGEESRHASRAYAEFLPRILRRIGEAEGALDIGTGDGAFLEQLERHGFRKLVGVEPSTAPVARARPHIRPLIRRSPFRAADFAPGSFSLVTCFQTLEHVAEPQSLCRQAHALLRGGGALFVVSHNRRALAARLLGRQSPIFDIEHLQLFSPKSLRYALERAGFSDIELLPVENQYPLRYWLKLLPLPRALKLPALRRLRASRLGDLPITIATGDVAAIAYKQGAASKPTWTRTRTRLRAGVTTH